MGAAGKKGGTTVKRLSTARLLALVAGLVAIAAVAAAGTMAARGSTGQTPRPKPLDRALRDALTAPQPAGVTARVTFRNNLFPSTAGLPGPAGSALVAGGSGRLWWSADGRGRIELQSDAGDAQILWNRTRLTVWDSSSNTVYTLPLPARKGTGGAKPPDRTPSLGDIDTFLRKLAQHASVSDPIPSSIAGVPAYRVTVSPAQPAGLVGSLALAWDADHGVPLEIAVRARGESAPALALTVTDISFGPVGGSELDISPPADAHRVDLGAPGGASGADQKPVTGLEAVQQAVPFTLVAPDRLAGLQRRRVDLLGGSDPGALVRYGRGLGTIALVEHAAGQGAAGLGPMLPPVPLGDGTTGHELATPLGTLLLFERNGVRIALAGSVTAHTAEAAARGLG